MRVNIIQNVNKNNSSNIESSMNLFVLLLAVVGLAFIGSYLNGFKKETFSEIFIRAAGSMLAVILYNYLSGMEQKKFQFN